MQWMNGNCSDFISLENYIYRPVLAITGEVAERRPKSIMPLQPIDWGFIGGIATDVVFGYFMFKLYKYGNQCVTDIQVSITKLEVQSVSSQGR